MNGKDRARATWRGMRQRCFNHNNWQYRNYGGRGITICERWSTFEGFFSDMGERPAGLTIERLNNDGNYEPTNCKWATRAEQLLTRRNHNQNRLKTHCKRGHEFTPENSMVRTDGSRRCKVCSYMRQARHSGKSQFEQAARETLARESAARRELQEGER